MFFSFSARARDFSKFWGRLMAKWPKIPVLHDFPPLGVRSSRTENVKRLRTTILKIVVTFSPAFRDPLQREFALFRFRPGPGISLSAKGRPRPKWPKTPIFCIFCFQPAISTSAKGCPGPKGPQNPVFCDFPPVRARSTKT